MINLPLMVRARVCAVTLSAAVLLSCGESPFEPRGEGERIPIGIVIEGQTRPDSISRFSFTGSPNQPYLVFLEALEGRVQLSVYDSTHGYPGYQYPAATVSAVAGGPWLEQNPSNTFATPSGAVYRVFVSASPAGTTARFRLKVHAIETNPERTLSSFFFGDTVSGETIDPMFDLDWFSAYGVAGQDIVAVVEPQEPVGSGSVALSVIDQAENQFLGSVFADAGTPTPLTTGLIRLPATRDYRFAFGSVISSPYPRYRGRYRFWTYVIDRAPEHRAAVLPVNTEIGNERIDRAGDVDEFTFVANAGTYYNAFVQGRGRTFQLEIARQGGEPIAIATSEASDTALFARATNRFRITQAGTHVVRLTGTNPHQVADTGGYRVYLYAINGQPERVPATITPGDTVSGEDIGLPGDVDEFTFTGIAGEEYNAFLQAENGSGDTHLQLEVVGPAGTVLRSAESIGSDTSLLGQVTGRFALPSGGTYRLRISGAQSYNDRDRGSYRLFLYQINRKPETSPDVFAFGDSVGGEAIDLPGDVDEFRVTVTDSSGANLAFALEDPPQGGYLTVQLVDSASGQILATADAYAAGRAALGRMRIAPGKYLVRVDANRHGNQFGERSSLRGAYRLWFYRFGFGPEVAADTFAIGDTVSSEALEPWGDEDDFRFHGLRGQHVNVMVQGLAPSSGGWFQFFVIPPPGAPGYGAFISTGTASAALEDHQTTRLDLPATGWYTVQVTGGGGGFSERGPYRFVVLPLDPGPEHVSATLAAGDSVVSEGIDALGDWDEFTLLGTPGETMGVLFNSTVFTGLYLRVFDPATDETLALQPNQFLRLAGPFRIPASGQVQISVAQPAGFFRLCYDRTCGGLFNSVGAYAFRVIVVNPAPEIAAAAFTVGDTVRGETIAPIGDLDEFTTSATPGASLNLHARLLANPVPAGGIVWMEILDAATGTVLRDGFGLAGGSTWPSYALASVIVPPSGSLRMRFKGYSRWGDELATAPYEFVLKP